MTQEEITKWERENFNKIVSWEIHYFDDHDVIIFKQKDGTKIEFIRDKNKHT